MRRAIAQTVSTRPRLAWRMLATGLGALALSACSVGTDAALQNPEPALELREVDGVDVAHIPRASAANTADAASQPRQGVPLVLTAGDAPDRPAAPSGTGGVATEPAAVVDSDLTGQSASPSESESRTQSPSELPSAGAPEAEPVAQNQAATLTTSVQAAPLSPAGEAAPADEPQSELESATQVPPTPVPTTPVPTTSPAMPTPAPTTGPAIVAATATPAPVVSDQLEVRAQPATPAPVGADPEPVDLSESGALACARVELALGDLDRGDLASFGAAMQTAAGYASAADESEIVQLEATVSGAASAAQPIDAITTFLTACANHGYEL